MTAVDVAPGVALVMTMVLLMVLTQMARRSSPTDQVPITFM
jgi:hypothetical protein